jgi:galactoside O-acetyltransferase
MFYHKEELLKFGFKHVGSNVLISDKASLYGCDKISLDDHVRIDDFCILSAGVGGITIGKYVHVAAYTSLIGQGQIILEDFCNLSSKVAIYSSNDDYLGAYMTNPMVPSKYTNVTTGKVHLKKHTIVGSGSVILPNVTLGEGCAVGALSFVNKCYDEFVVIAGNPAKIIKSRKKDLKDFEIKLMENYK